MGAIPYSPRPALIAWAQAHIQPWTDHAAEIGLDNLLVSQYAGLVTAYQAAAADAEAARQAAEVATRDATAAFTALRRATTANVTTIRTFAQRQTKPDVVYSLAEITPRQDPSALPPPGQPTNLAVSLVSATGALQLTWKCVNPVGAAGTSYIIRRRLPTESTFSFIGVTGERRYVDNTFIAGPDSVQYNVQAQRADSAGPLSEAFIIRFGRTGPGREINIESAGTQAATTTQKVA
ncbi:MAG: hypothetical protein ACK5VN_16200 [Phycisphaerae bacterium]